MGHGDAHAVIPASKWWRQEEEIKVIAATYWVWSKGGLHESHSEQSEEKEVEEEGEREEEEWLSLELALSLPNVWPFTAIPYVVVVVSPNHKITSLLFHNCYFATVMNCNYLCFLMVLGEP